jgi:hypothetical protein
VRDRVEESCLLFGDAHLADEEHRVDDEAGDDQGEGDDAEHERREAPPLTMIQPMLSVTAAATRTTQRTTRR